MVIHKTAMKESQNTSKSVFVKHKKIELTVTDEVLEELDMCMGKKHISIVKSVKTKAENGSILCSRHKQRAKEEGKGAIHQSYN